MEFVETQVLQASACIKKLCNKKSQILNNISKLTFITFQNGRIKDKLSLYI